MRRRVTPITNQQRINSEVERRPIARQRPLPTKLLVALNSNEAPHRARSEIA
jgi:hypothetical protein